MSDAPFPGRVIVQNLCYKSIKALGYYSLRVKNHLLSNMLYFLGENSLGTIRTCVNRLTGTKLVIFRSHENATSSTFKFID